MIRKIWQAGKSCDELGKLRQQTRKIRMQRGIVTPYGRRSKRRENNWKLRRPMDAPQNGGKTIGSCE